MISEMASSSCADNLPPEASASEVSENNLQVAPLVAVVGNLLDFLCNSKDRVLILVINSFIYLCYAKRTKPFFVLHKASQPRSSTAKSIRGKKKTKSAANESETSSDIHRKMDAFHSVWSKIESNIKVYPYFKYLHSGSPFKTDPCLILCFFFLLQGRLEDYKC